jgi:multiple sugar transport system ATP-binding protein
LADILVKGVRKAYDRGRVSAVGGSAGIDLTIRDGELFVLLGPSGCGKTTLLRMIAGLEACDSGAIMIGSRDVTDLPPRRRDLAMVFQNYAVFPHLTVRQNIGFGLRMKGGVGGGVIDSKVRWAAGLVELSELLDRRPAQLSGGQRQRVAVARALAVSPSVLLMDEPLSNLDALLRMKFRSDLKRIVREVGTTVIYVTHDQVEALSLGDRMAVMKDGLIVQVDAPLSVYDRPDSTFVGGFLGTPPMNFLPVAIDTVEASTVEASTGEASTVEASTGEASTGEASTAGSDSADDGVRAMVGPDGDAFSAPESLRGHAGRELLAGIRGENVELTDEARPGFVRGKVAVIEPLGSATQVTLTVAGSELKVVAAASFTAPMGGTLWLRPVADKVRWYDPDTGMGI